MQPTSTVNSAKHTHMPEVKPFERLHADWAHVSKVGNVLVIVEAASGWIEAFPFNDRKTTSVISSFNTVISRFGVPKQLVTDNGSEFV